MVTVVGTEGNHLVVIFSQDLLKLFSRSHQAEQLNWVAPVEQLNWTAPVEQSRLIVTLITKVLLHFFNLLLTRVLVCLCANSCKLSILTHLCEMIQFVQLMASYKGIPGTHL